MSSKAAKKEQVPDKPDKPDKPKQSESVKGLTITLASLKKSGFTDDSKEVKAILNLIDKEK